MRKTSNLTAIEKTKAKIQQLKADKANRLKSLEAAVAEANRALYDSARRTEALDDPAADVRAELERETAARIVERLVREQMRVKASSSTVTRDEADAVLCDLWQEFHEKAVPVAGAIRDALLHLWDLQRQLYGLGEKYRSAAAEWMGAAGGYGPGDNAEFSCMVDPRLTELYQGSLSVWPTMNERKPSLDDAVQAMRQRSHNCPFDRRDVG